MLPRTKHIIHQTLITIRPDQFLGTPSAGAYVRKEQTDNQNAFGKLMIPDRILMFMTDQTKICLLNPVRSLELLYATGVSLLHLHLKNLED